ncbi:MAG: Mu transposase C-terminal domain-containing protein [Burkholderiaceae bacterium]
MAGFAFRKSTIFDWSGTRFRVREISPNSELLIEVCGTGEMKLVPTAKLLEEYTAGRLSACIDDAELSAAKASYGRPLEDLPKRVREEALRRLHYVRAISLDGVPVFTNAHLRPVLKAAAAELSDRDVPSVSSAFRWYRRYANARGDARALIPRFHLRGRKKARQSERLLELLGDAVAEAFKASPRATGPNIHSRLVAKVEAANRLSLNADPIRVPALRTTYRLLRRAEVYEMVSLRDGKASADRRFRVVRAGVRSTRIMERVEIDHTPLDLFLIDERTWLPLGRPTLTMAIDHFSRMPVGYHLSFGDPSAAAVVGTIRHAVLPKTLSSVALPDLPIVHDWPAYGLFETLVCDNGLEFHGIDLEGIAFDLGITLQFCPKREPRFKGAIERYLKTVNYFFAHQLPGTSMARLHERGDYDPLRHALLTFGEFKQLLEKWVVDVYAETLHRGINTTPRRRWDEGMALHTPNLPTDLRMLQRRIGQSAERKLRRTGVEVNGIFYNSDELNSILRKYGEGVDVRIVFDPEDLGTVQVWAPNVTDPIAVQAVDFAYADGLTLRQNKLVRETLLAAGQDAVDGDALQRARDGIATMISELMVSRKLRARRRSAALRGISSTKPEPPASPSASGPAVKPTKKPATKPKSKISPTSPPDKDGLPPLLSTFQLKRHKGGKGAKQ